MVTLTRLDGTEFVLNSDLIETIEEKPDTTIRLTTKQYMIVKESADEVVRKIIGFRREINASAEEKPYFTGYKGLESEQ